MTVSGRPAGAGRRRAHGRAVHQHAAAAACARARASRLAICCGGCRRQARAAGAAACRAGRDPAAGRAGRAVRHAVVFENYPVDAAGWRRTRGVRLAGVSGQDATHYPLSLMARPPGAAPSGLRCGLDYRPDLFDRGTVAALAAAADPAAGGRRLRRRIVPVGALELLSCVGAPAIAGGVERDRAAGRAGAAAGAVCGAGGAHAGCGRGGVRAIAAAELRRARGAGQPAGASSARAGRRARDRGRAVRGALAGAAGRASRHPQGRRRLPAARPVVSGGAAGVHAGGRRRRACWSARPRCSSGCRPRWPRRPRPRARPHPARSRRKTARTPISRTLVRLDADWPAIARQPAAAPALDARSAAPGLCDLHLGLDRNPKGVVVEHGALSNFLCRDARAVPLGAADRLLAVTTIGFDIAALELYLPLIAGAGVVLARAPTVQEPAALLALLALERGHADAGDADAVAGAAEPGRALKRSPSPRLAARPIRCTKIRCTRCVAPESLASMRCTSCGFWCGGEALPGRAVAGAVAARAQPAQSLRPDRDHDLVGGDGDRGGSGSGGGRGRHCRR